MSVLFALLFVASQSLNVSGTAVTTLIAEPGPLTFEGTVNGCRYWAGTVDVSANVPWLITVDVADPCGSAGPVIEGTNAQAQTIDVHVGSRSPEPVTVVTIQPKP